ncbi:MAG: YkgJ family cysteine cluster protein [Proteobacteria bacterium]|jgi:Fe-S-cluster containining protein|nr:YkgJ family cysteine cluster protein [Desulfocapsa sp.]MBU3943552.1 YkgJ family cysteine cluster protein [Pseudomonadota bacterium]MCG2743440.1 YkgJ family cysteine cluster protein [Desulfobacteraceae bacterium]MDO8947292.1 YkgJ family cysteine cluster protein [Desulfocapsaceae bacterium]MBU4028915.1 YkgJ family cysteine cluster protein [Pseudomonadota bacterium]
MNSKKEFPEGMVPLGIEKFQFSCHAGVQCYMSCCKNVDMFLYPYDIVRLKKSLKIDSESFMRLYTRLVKGSHPYFPAVMLKLNNDEEKSCPFLAEGGCSVYHDRPSACRTYPLERAVDRLLARGRSRDYYFLTDHAYCLGHKEEKFYSVTQWIRDQQLQDYNGMNDRWTELDTIFSLNPWKGEGSGGPKQQMAFMVCYDVDGFRSLAHRKHLFDQFRLTKDQKDRIQIDDTALLQFGFDWLKLFLTGTSSLMRR